MSGGPQRVGIKLVIERWASRAFGIREWFLVQRVTEYDLRPTKGFKKGGSERRTAMQASLPKGWQRGYSRTEHLLMGRNLKDRVSRCLNG